MTLRLLRIVFMYIFIVCNNFKVLNINRVLQGITGDFRGLQGLHGITGDYMELQVITGRKISWSISVFGMSTLTSLS